MKYKEGVSWDDIPELKRFPQPLRDSLILFAEKWAGLMERKMESGEAIKDIIDSTAVVASLDIEEGIDGVSAVFFITAACALSFIWAYGKEFFGAFDSGALDYGK